METATLEPRRSRGRPQVRCDDDTRRLIAEVARGVFVRSGYAAASMDEVARSAGVSKKTLYRLIPCKADLFKAAVIERIDRFILTLDDHALAGMSTEAALAWILTQYGLLTLSDETIGVNRLVLAERDTFPELASDFYQHAVVATQTVMARYLARQRDAGKIAIDDCFEAAGMLRGMMIMDPQRAVMLGGAALPDEKAIAARATRCVRLFLDGCRRDGKGA